MNGSPVNNHPGQTLADRLAGMDGCICHVTVSTMFRLRPAMTDTFSYGPTGKCSSGWLPLPPAVAVAPTSLTPCGGTPTMLTQDSSCTSGSGERRGIASLRNGTEPRPFETRCTRTRWQVASSGRGYLRETSVPFSFLPPQGVVC